MVVTRASQLIILIFAFASFSPLCSADSPTNWDMIGMLGPGINLGNVFDAPEGEGAWWHGRVQPEFLDDFRAAGFKHVRLPVTWGKHMQGMDPFTVDEDFMDRIAQVVGWAIRSGLIVVLNAHHEEWYKQDPEAQTERFESLWRQIAHRFKDVP